MRQCARPLTSCALTRVFSWGRKSCLWCEYDPVKARTLFLYYFFYYWVYSWQNPKLLELSKTALIFWQLQSLGIAGEAQKRLCAFPCLRGQVSLCHTDPACSSERAHSGLQQSPLLPSEGVPLLFVLPLAPFPFPLIHRTLPAGICNMFRRILK